MLADAADGVRMRMMVLLRFEPSPLESEEHHMRNTDVISDATISCHGYLPKATLAICRTEFRHTVAERGRVAAAPDWMASVTITSTRASNSRTARSTARASWHFKYILVARCPFGSVYKYEP